MAPIIDNTVNGSEQFTPAKKTLPEVEESGNGYTFETLKATADFLLARISTRPTVGIICGSGMGSLAESLVDQECFPYESIPNFPVSTVEGHHGQLVFGRLAGVSVVCMQGRFHYYEGYPLWKGTTAVLKMLASCRAKLSRETVDDIAHYTTCALPVRVMKLLGVKQLVATNAAGGLNPGYEVGDIMVVRDHINMMGFAGNNPLHGPNDERFGPRFPPMNKAYDVRLRQIAKEVAKELNIEKLIHEGVYTCLGGPNFETVAELKMLQMVGVDAVGMSTVHEVITARHCDMTVFALSLITNKCETCDSSAAEANHDEVLDVGRLRQATLAEFVSRLVTRFQEPLDK